MLRTVQQCQNCFGFKLTKDTTYLTGELGGVACELFIEKWPRYIESVLYI